MCNPIVARTARLCNPGVAREWTGSDQVEICRSTSVQLEQGRQQVVERGVTCGTRGRCDPVGPGIRETGLSGWPTCPLTNARVSSAFPRYPPARSRERGRDELRPERPARASWVGERARRSLKLRNLEAHQVRGRGADAHARRRRTGGGRNRLAEGRPRPSRLPPLPLVRTPRSAPVQPP